jgi:hypothetical protein
MASNFRDLFIQRVTTGFSPPLSDELNRLAEQIASQLACLETTTAAGALSALNERVVQQYAELRKAAESTDIFRPIPVPPEVIEEANRTFDEQEILEGIREIRRTGGRKFEEIIQILETLPNESNES